MLSPLSFERSHNECTTTAYHVWDIFLWDKYIQNVVVGLYDLACVMVHLFPYVANMVGYGKSGEEWLNRSSTFFSYTRDNMKSYNPCCGTLGPIYTPTQHDVRISSSFPFFFPP